MRAYVQYAGMVTTSVDAVPTSPFARYILTPSFARYLTFPNHPRCSMIYAQGIILRSLGEALIVFGYLQYFHF